VSESTSRVVRARVFRRILVLTVGVEAVTVVGLGVVLAVDAVAHRGGSSVVGDLVLGATFVALGAGLLLVARAAGRGRRGARAPIVVWQLIQALVGSRDALPVGALWGVVLIVLAVVAVVAAFWPGVLADAEPTDESSDGSDGSASSGDG
jgi:hypothetical protein